MTVEDLADRLAGVGDRMRRRITAAEEESARAGREALVERSSGTLTRRDLMRMGHPFAVRAPQTPLDPARINHQKDGSFRDAWEQEPATVTAEAVEVRVVNRDPAAQWMHGTVKMVARPIVDAVRAEQAADRRRRLDEAAADALKGS